MQFGLQELDGPNVLPRHEVVPPAEVTGNPGMAEASAPFESAPLAGFRPEVLMSRKFRDQSFARQVKAAYGGRCAISGLELRNGGGRPEVEAAHIRPVAHNGPDIVRNGLALSGTLHWMFDRGLISVASDYRILVSHNKVDGETIKRLIAPEQKLFLPENKKDYPHPEYLRFHRETVFGQVA
ncbi:MAG: HNH endonuclease [Rhodobacterales bacterium]|nr:HNH endonuclease [Rhodobacterales bacterium]